MSGPLVLASASPRRAELLAAAGFRFVVRPADVDESTRPEEAPAEYVLRVAVEKLDAVGAADDEAVLAADTTVVLDGVIFGKPEDEADARRMLTALAGRTHEVLTGVAVGWRGRRESAVVRTAVTFVPLGPQEIAEYVASGEPFGKAGGYAIQGRAARFVESIEGSWSNVVGLPVATVHQLLRRLGRVD
jgi:septum formation protein